MSNHAHTRQCIDPQLRQWLGDAGDAMQSCRTCGKVSRVKERPEAVVVATDDQADSPEAAHGRFWLACCRCDGGTWVPSPRRRVPLCEPCKAAR